MAKTWRKHGENKVGDTTKLPETWVKTLAKTGDGQVGDMRMKEGGQAGDRRRTKPNILDRMKQPDDMPNDGPGNTPVHDYRHI